MNRTILRGVFGAAARLGAFLPAAAGLVAVALSVATCAAAVASSTAAPNSGGLYKVGAITVETPWTRATPGGARVAGGYLRITNTGSEPDRLVGATFAAAGRSEVHEMAVKEGVMTMRPLEHGLAIAPGQSVELKPGGFHVMFFDLQSSLQQGATVRGTLIFEKAGTIEVDYAVAGIGAETAAPPAPGGAPRGGDQHQHQ